MNHNQFAEETLEKMKKTLKDTKDKELAFVLCKSRDKKITHGKPTCIGSKRKVYYGSKCKSNEKIIGSFHTHR